MFQYVYAICEFLSVTISDYFSIGKHLQRSSRGHIRCALVILVLTVLYWCTYGSLFRGMHVCVRVETYCKKVFMIYRAVHAYVYTLLHIQPPSMRTIIRGGRHHRWKCAEKVCGDSFSLFLTGKLPYGVLLGQPVVPAAPV